MAGITPRTQKVMDDILDSNLSKKSSQYNPNHLSTTTQTHLKTPLTSPQAQNHQNTITTAIKNNTTNTNINTNTNNVTFSNMTQTQTQMEIQLTNSKINNNNEITNKQQQHGKSDSVTLRMPSTTLDTSPISPNTLPIITPKNGINGLNTNMNRQSPARSPSHSQYLQRLDTIKSTVKSNKEIAKHEKKKSLLYSPYVVWYLANRYGCTQGMYAINI